jgi:hypothetical protein
MMKDYVDPWTGSDAPIPKRRFCFRSVVRAFIWASALALAGACGAQPDDPVGVSATAPSDGSPADADGSPAEASDSDASSSVGGRDAGGSAAHSSDAGAAEPGGAGVGGTSDSGGSAGASVSGSSSGGALGENSVTVGPEGGHFLFTGGIVLNVPAGALSSTVTIEESVVSLPGAMQGMGLPIAPVVSLLPEGLEFQIPLQLELPMPSVGRAQSVAVSSEALDPTLENVALSQAADGNLALALWHFSTYGVFGTDGAPQLVSDATACSTAPVRGLSKQIELIFRQLSGTLVELSDPRITSADPLGAPLVQANVASAILAALNDPAATGTALPFQVNSGWLSLAAQYVLSHCKNGGAAVPPGTGDHEDGSAFDLAGPYANAAACTAALTPGETRAAVRDSAHPMWGALLEQQGLLAYGSQSTHDVCGDPPHFDDIDVQSATLRALAITAFQKLWNNNHPCDQIEESGVFDADTAARLPLSPAAGFAAGAGGITLLSGGILGGGCPAGSGDPTAITCCAGGTCHDTLTENDNCGACGVACLASWICNAGHCVCPAGQTACGSTCVDTKSDPKNCGACSTACNQPPLDVCDTDALQHYEAQGSCSSGKCYYEDSIAPCPGSEVCCGSSCFEPGADPTGCCGIECNDPPKDTCDDSGQSVIHHGATGTCSFGNCSYSTTTTPCASGELCYDGECGSCLSRTSPNACLNEVPTADCCDDPTLKVTCTASPGLRYLYGCCQAIRAQGGAGWRCGPGSLPLSVVVPYGSEICVVEGTATGTPSLDPADGAHCVPPTCTVAGECQ